MNENSGKVMTQTKIEVLEKIKCDMKSDDRAREVSESRMSAEVEICETNDEWTRMNEKTSVDIAKYETDWLFPHEPMNFVHRKCHILQDI